MKSVDWVHESVKQTKGVSVPTIHVPHDQLEAHLFKLLGVAKWFCWLKINTANQTVLYPELEHYMASMKTTCAHLNVMYCKNELDVTKCVKTFKYHFNNNIWSYFTVKIMLDLLDGVLRKN